MTRTASSRALYAAMALSGAALLVQGCMEKPQEVAEKVPPAYVYQIDTKGGATSCQVADVALEPGKAVITNMQLGNDGGWCAIKLRQHGPKPYAVGLLTTEPQHGEVYIHSVGYDTRIDYTPTHGYAGADNFVVQLLPGDAVLDTHVVVQTAGK